MDGRVHEHCQASIIFTETVTSTDLVDTLMVATFIHVRGIELCILVNTATRNQVLKADRNNVNQHLLNFIVCELNKHTALPGQGYAAYFTLRSHGFYRSTDSANEYDHEIKM